MVILFAPFGPFLPFPWDKVSLTSTDGTELICLNMEVHTTFS